MNFETVLPKSGGWVGWYSISEDEMLKVFFEVELNFNSDGSLTGSPREQSQPFECKGKVTSKKRKKKKEKDNIYTLTIIF